MKKNHSIVCLAQSFMTFVFAIINPKTSNFRFSNLPGKVSMAILLLAVFVVPAFSQDDDDVIAGKVLDAGNRQIGKAELILNRGDVKTNFGYDIKIWLNDGSRLRIVKQHPGSRTSTINCSFREYKVDSNNPKDDSRWDETGSGNGFTENAGIGRLAKDNSFDDVDEKSRWRR